MQEVGLPLVSLSDEGMLGSKNYKRFVRYSVCVIDLVCFFKNSKC